MLQWATAGRGKRLGILVLHDDATCACAHGQAHGLPDTEIGTFSQALYDAASLNGRTVISLKRDWKRIVAFEGRWG
jgi:hypothetical protein